MHLGRRIAVSFVAAALSVSGCTGREPEVTEPSRTATGSVRPQPSTSPTPTPTGAPVSPPVPPPELAQPNTTGAEAAATYFLELYPYLLETGDFTQWEQLSSSECEFCRSTREYVSGTLSSGGFFEGGQLDATVVMVHPIDEVVGAYPIDVDISQGATIEYSADGEVAATTDDETFASQVDVALVDGGWKILEVSDRSAP
jgi:hypothetical protein